MRYVVTGAAGFIGSALSKKLLDMGHSVIGIDCFLENLYPNDRKFENIRKLREKKEFTFHNLDLRESSNHIDLEGVETVYHLAAMAGLKSVWTDFKIYQDCNLLATNILLQNIKSYPGVKLVYASTSSVYGRVATGGEDLPTNPCSPYGVTKLAAEALIKSYDLNFGLDHKILRLFSVYGPNQRPDMAYSRIIEKIYNKEEIEIFGDGEQVRSNTYIDDVIDALVIADVKNSQNSIYNVAGNESISLNSAIKCISENLGKSALLKYGNVRDGDQLTTEGKSHLLCKDFGWRPQVNFETGIQMQIEHFLKNKMEIG